MAENKSHHVGTLSPEMALLGQLYGSPGHGYDLHRKVFTDLGYVWHLSQSQAYAILKRIASYNTRRAQTLFGLAGVTQWEQRSHHQVGVYHPLIFFESVFS